MYELLVGPIAPGLVVMHTCDNPPCVNPKHLRPGTQAENLADMRAKGRQPLTYARDQLGERNNNSKLSDKQIVEMRTLFADGVRQAELARRFGVTPANVHVIVRNKSRSNVAGRV